MGSLVRRPEAVPRKCVWLSLTQQARAGFKVFLSAGGSGFGGFGVLVFEVGEVCLAITTADDVEMELNVVGFGLRNDIEQVTAELAAAGTTEPMTAPDLSQRVQTSVATTEDDGQTLRQLGRLPQALFNAGHFFGRQGFVEIGFELPVGEHGCCFVAI